MSLESIVLCSPCLSLSLLFCLDLCLSGGGGVESPAPTRMCEWAEGSTEEVSPGGRGASRFFCFLKASPGGRGASSVIFLFFRRSFLRCGRAAARSAQLLFAGGHCVRAITIWVRPHDGHLQGFGRTSGGRSDVGRHFSARTRYVPKFRWPAEADCRCSDRDPVGHGSGNSSCP